MQNLPWRLASYSRRNLRAGTAGRSWAGRGGAVRIGGGSWIGGLLYSGGTCSYYSNYRSWGEINYHGIGNKIVKENLEGME